MLARPVYGFGVGGVSQVGGWIASEAIMPQQTVEARIVPLVPNLALPGRTSALTRAMIPAPAELHAQGAQGLFNEPTTRPALTARHETFVDSFYSELFTN
jgi:hypothetical protein